MVKGYITPHVGVARGVTKSYITPHVGVARGVVKGYITHMGVARGVVKGYITPVGVARGVVKGYIIPWVWTHFLLPWFQLWRQTCRLKRKKENKHTLMYM